MDRNEQQNIYFTNFLSGDVRGTQQTICCEVVLVVNQGMVNDSSTLVFKSKRLLLTQLLMYLVYGYYSSSTIKDRDIVGRFP